jgi:hypothetical protein
MRILIRRQNDGEWHLVDSAIYSDEKELQYLLAEDPSIIPIHEVRPNASPLVFAIREFPLTIGSIDLLAFSAEGDIAIIECKLASNSEIKRKVIGQVLEYGANLWEMRYEELDEVVRYRQGENLAELIRNSVRTSEWNEEQFRRQVDYSLVNGKFILVIVVDEINEELTRIVRFINLSGNSNFDFAALEMRRFQAENTEMLVPSVFGPMRVSKQVISAESAKPWDEASFFAEMMQRHGEESTQVARRIYTWAKQRVQIWWGKGKQLGSFVPYFEHKGREHQLFAVYTYGGVETYFYWHSFKPPFDSPEKRLAMLDKLNGIDGIDLPRESIDKRPSINLSILAKGDSLDRFLEVYDWVISEIKKS